MKKIILIILAVLPLSGCLGLGPTQNVYLKGTIYHGDTNAYVYNAKIEVKVGDKHYTVTSNVQGIFEIWFPSKKTSFTLNIRHSDYESLTIIMKNAKTSEPLKYNLIPKKINQALVTGRVDYALPSIEDPVLHGKSLTMDLITYPEPEPNEIIITPTLYSEVTAEQLIQDLNAGYYRLYPASGIIVLGKPVEQELNAFLNKARAHPWVEEAEINYPVVPQSFSQLYEPNDIKYREQWSLTGLYLPWAWKITTGNPQIKIAVLDTGVDIYHEDLTHNLNLKDAYSVYSQDNDVRDPGHPDPFYRPISHGTHVIGIIGADTNNLRGISGIAWQTEIIPIQVIQQVSGTLADLAEGIEKAIELDVDIINLSLGIYEDPKEPYNNPLYRALNRAQDRGIIIVAAAGNQGRLIYPAKYPDVIAVGAITKDYDIANYSPTSQVKLFAFGGHGDNSTQIISTDLNNTYSTSTGTSMAAPQVTGLIGLIKSIYPYIDSYEVEHLLWNTGIILNPDYPQQRLVNAYAALAGTPIEDVNLKFVNQDNPEFRYLVSLDPNRHFYQLLEPGEYLITAHIDANGDGLVNNGEWYWEKNILIQEGDVITDFDIRLKIQH